MSTRTDARAIVLLFGGPTTLAVRINRSGEDISLKAINMWIFRESIPASWLGILAGFAKQDSIPFDITQYMVRGDREEEPDLDFLD